MFYKRCNNTKNLENNKTIILLLFFNFPITLFLTIALKVQEDSNEIIQIVAL